MEMIKMNFWEFLCQPALIIERDEPQEQKRKLKYVESSISDDDIAGLLEENKRLRKALICTKAELIENKRRLLR
jgi:hypothetical protein